MRQDDPQHWQRCAMIHDSFWQLHLTKIERLAYLYLCSFCNKPFAISLTLMAEILGIKACRLKVAIDRLVEMRMVSKTTRKGYASLFQITIMRIKGWGQTALPLTPNGATPLAPNGVEGWGQTALLTANLDTEFLHIFHDHFKKWTFNRKPIGRHFVFGRKLQVMALECMRHLHRTGFSTPQRFHAFLEGCGEYLSLPRDVLSAQKDQRALSPGKWLYTWDEQIRLVGIYMDEKDQKITRIETGEQL